MTGVLCGHALRNKKAWDEPADKSRKLTMLESAGLLLLPREKCAHDPTGRNRPGTFSRQIIKDAATLADLGFVCRGRRLWSFRRPRWEIYETEDVSLLMTVRPPWWFWRAWEFFDAENRCRGFRFRTWLFDTDGQPLALMHTSQDGGVIRFLNPSGLELAACRLQGPSEWLLSFANCSNPFARMTILGTALSLT